MKDLLNCRSFIFLVVLFSFIDNFGMGKEKDKQFFEGKSIKRLEMVMILTQTKFIFIKVSHL